MVKYTRTGVFKGPHGHSIQITWHISFSAFLLIRRLHAECVRTLNFEIKQPNTIKSRKALSQNLPQISFSVIIQRNIQSIMLNIRSFMNQQNISDCLACAHLIDAKKRNSKLNKWTRFSQNITVSMYGLFILLSTEYTHLDKLSRSKFRFIFSVNIHNNNQLCIKWAINFSYNPWKKKTV